MQTLQEIRSLLDAYGLAPKRSMGQNFLIDQNLIRGLVDASGVAAGELVLEIGPGTGTLTEELLDRGCRVVACELDNGMVRLLTDRFRDRSTGQFTLIAGDCLAGKSELNPEITESLGGSEFRLIANLPYGAASPLMVLLARNSMCLGQYVTIQREVAERITARPGSRAYGRLSVLAQWRFEPRIVLDLPPQAFTPPPKVSSAVVHILPRPAPLAPARPEALTRLVAAAFNQRR
ncbi:MAG: 16S rRNA (adenine(1518)-N(6)/adenine(1519)-N(6))-dimethyltransferase RsmA, partial [Phycisphaerales bacterium]